MKKKLFSAKCVFKFDRIKNNDGETAYEERIVILKARTDDEAIELAEEDAKKYAESERGKYLGYINVYKLFESDIEFNGIKEVYSLMRHDEDNEEDYLDFFYDTGSECVKHWKEGTGSSSGID